MRKHFSITLLLVIAWLSPFQVPSLIANDGHEEALIDLSIFRDMHYLSKFDMIHFLSRTESIEEIASYFPPPWVNNEYFNELSPFQVSSLIANDGHEEELIDLSIFRDMHYLSKSYMIHFLSRIENIEEIASYFPPPWVNNEYFNKLSLEAKREAIQRYYTFGAAVEILRDEYIDILSSPIEGYRQEVAEKYGIEIQVYPDFIDKSDITPNIANALILINVLAITDIKTILESEENGLISINFTSPHDRRIIYSIFNTIQFFAFAELDEIFEGNAEMLSKLEDLSNKLFSGHSSNAEVADSVNALFLEKENH